jgi:hypothetical protein
MRTTDRRLLDVSFSRLDSLVERPLMHGQRGCNERFDVTCEPMHFRGTHVLPLRWKRHARFVFYSLAHMLAHILLQWAKTEMLSDYQAM